LVSRCVWSAGKKHEVARFDFAAYELDQTFGRETFTYTNRNGNTAIAKPVLQAFKVLTATNVVWARSSRA